MARISKKKKKPKESREKGAERFTDNQAKERGKTRKSIKNVSGRNYIHRKIAMPVQGVEKIKEKKKSRES